MKRNYLIALAITATCGLVLFGEPAQGGSVTVFNDTFGSGSTLNQAPTTPTTNSTSYEFGVGFVPASTNAGYSSISPNDLSLTLPNMTTVLGEIQARFTSVPVRLATPGDYINLWVTFVDTANILSGSGRSNSTLNIGLYNSGGSAPQQGPITFASTTNATGGAQNWQGYAGRIIYFGWSELFTRPAQTNATSAQNQELLFNGVSSDQSFRSPLGDILGFQGGSGLTNSLANLSTNTMNFKIALTPGGFGNPGITVTNALYAGTTTNGMPFFSMGAWTNSILTSSFDGLAAGWRCNSSTPTNSTMDIQSITVTYGFGKSWANGTGKWEEFTPSIADTAEIITNADSKTVTIDATTSGLHTNSMAINHLVVSGPGAAINTLLLDNAGTLTPLHVAGIIQLGTNGHMVIVNSAVVGDNSVSIGNSSPSSSLVVSNDGSLIVTNSSRTGSVVVNGGSFLVGVGTFKTDNLVVTNGGVLQHAQTYRVDNATVTIAGGTSQFGSNLVVGSSANATGSVAMTSGSLVVSNGVIGVGNNGTYTDGSGVGQMTVSNAAVTAQSIVLGNNAGGSGALSIGLGGIVHMLPGAVGCAACGMKLNDLTLDGGAIDSPDNDMYAGQGIPGALIVNDGTATFRSAFVGVDNTGSMTMAGGSMNVLSNLTAGSGTGSTGTVIMTGGTLVVTNGVLGIGNNGTLGGGSGVSQMILSNATVAASTILLGSSAGGRGEFLLADGGSVGSAGTNSVLVANDFNQVGGNLSWTNIGSALYCGYAHRGAYALSNGTASCQDFYVGFDNAGTMTIAGGTMTILSGLTVGHLGSPMSTGAVWVTGGQLTMVNQPAIIGNSGVGQMTISNGTVTAADVVVGNNSSNPGTLTLAGGIMTVSSLVATNANSVLAFNAGLLTSGGASVNNSQLFAVGNGSDAATYHLNGGVHSFANNLEVRNHAVLTGCGTVTGTVVVDSGGTVYANCDGKLTFTGAVTINGTMRAINGSILEAYGPVVNNGTIDIINGGVTNFHSGFFNNGTVLDAKSVRISQASKSSQDFVIQIPSVVGHTYQLQYTTSLTPTNWTNTGASQSGTGGVLTFTDPGGAAYPLRFYRVAVTAP
jgi:hypothetical protein